VLLVVSYVQKGAFGIVAGACAIIAFVSLWFAYPLVRRGYASRRG
jgi:hypothetical protein